MKKIPEATYYWFQTHGKETQTHISVNKEKLENLREELQKIKELEVTEIKETENPMVTVVSELIPVVT